MVRTETTTLSGHFYPILLALLLVSRNHHNPARTPPTDHIRLVQNAVQVGDLFSEKANDGRVLEKPVPVCLAPRAVPRFVRLVPVFAIVLDAFGRDLAREDLEVVHPPLDRGVVACARGVVVQITREEVVGFCAGIGSGLCVGLGDG